MFSPKIFLLILSLFIFLISCTPVNLNNQNDKVEKNEQKVDNKSGPNNNEEQNQKIEKNEINKNKQTQIDIKLNNKITVLFSKKDEKKIAEQFVNILELGVYDKKLDNVFFEIEYFKDSEDLNNIIFKSAENGKIYIGPINNQYTKETKKFCNKNIVFLSFSSDTNLANDCVYLLNFFPKNELQQLFNYLGEDSKVALLYPENSYGYMINNIIDDIANNSQSIIINRSSYKNDLSNVRNAIKELGKYELRKYELNRQKQILKNQNDANAKKRLKKLEKFKTTKDYDFTHILIADYGINLLQVAPLLPYYDIDPNIVQFIGTGVIDDDNFFFEPSLQGAIFPGIQKDKRQGLLENYNKLYDDNFRRISTLPYDLIGLLNFGYTNDMMFDEFLELLSDPKVKFEGIDGNFYFKNNIIERDLNILKISNGEAIPVD